MFTSVLAGWLDAMVLASRQRTAPWSTSLRGEVFPPPARPHHQRAAVADAQRARALRAVQAEFTQVLVDIRTQEAGALLERIRSVHSMQGLWHLRADVFHLVSRHRDQLEADRRVTQLNRHFPARRASPALALRACAGVR